MNAPARIQSLLRRTIGLDPAAIGDARIASAVRRRMAARAMSDENDYVVLLTTDDGEVQQLIEEVVVLETYFFREPAAFVVLADMVRDGTLPATPERPITILSLACATGEEPYSIAMTLLAAGCAQEAIRIDGVDVSNEAVRLAAEAHYGPTSFRSEMPEFASYFIRQGGVREVRRDVRSCVRFQQANLLASGFVPPRGTYDVLFCRNLLIYLDAAARQRVLAILARHLRPGGVLFVTPACAFAVRSGNFMPIAIDAACAFRRTGDATTPSSAKEVGGKARRRAIATGGGTSLVGRRHSAALLAPHLAHERAAAAGSADGVSRRGASPTAAGTAPALAEIAALADAGHLQEAAARAEAILPGAGASAELFVLLGTLRAALGDDERSEWCYRRALYLDSGHVDAMLHLALLLQRRGAPDEVARLQARARRAAPSDPA